MPARHGRYRGLELELLDPADEDEVTLLIEARHAQFAAALRCGQEMIIEGEAFSPRLHVAMHQTVANQLLADDPPETWQTVQRLAGMGYDWRIIMRMIATLISDGLCRAMHERWRLDPADYARRLHELPGDWPSPQAHRPY